MASITNIATTHRIAAAGLPVAQDGFAVLNALPVAVAVLDHDGVIRSVNEAWKRNAAEFAPGSAYCAACETCLETGADGLAAIEIGIRKVLTGEKDSFVAEFRRRIGGRVQVSVAPLRGISFQGVVVTHSAMTESGAPAESEDQRRQAEKMQAVGRLVGGVAHDFANLLTLISGYSEIVLNRMSSAEPLRGELEEIRKAATRGSRLTAQLLGFTRGQAIQPRILDLNALISDMEKMLRPIIGEHIELTTSLRHDLWKVKADSGQMEQVIMNLVLNARDAMPRGGKITIETANIDLAPSEASAHDLSAGPHVLLSFTDTGGGMSAEVMSHLFEPFFTTKEKGKGTGLGLSTVYGIVKQSGGDVWARSAPAEGTTFTICLPHAQAASESTEAAATARTPGHGTETILLVEDEDGVRRLLKHVLSRHGYTVLEAKDGPAALNLVAQYTGPIHLLLTDMVMPYMSGREVADRYLGMRPESKVIYMSGYTDDVLMRSGALGPGMSFLQKPLRPDALASKVREVLDAPARADGAAH